MTRGLKYMGYGILGLSGILLVKGFINGVRMTKISKARKKAEKDEKKQEEVLLETPKPISDASKGKKIHTKVADVALRESTRINNGWINNIYERVPVANTYIGIVKSTSIPDPEFLNPATGKPFVWVNFNYVKAPSQSLFVREDVINLK